jgi:hypothetical protein
MDMDEDTLVALLLGVRLPRIIEMEREHVVPSFLVAPYARETAARKAAELESLSPRLAAALLRAAFSDEEEDVRAAARLTLILRNEAIGDVVHFSLTMDSDPYVRDSAFDEALEVSDPQRRLRLIRQAVNALINDPCDFVRARAREFADR